MAITGKSSSERIALWEVLVTNIQPNLADMPYVGDDVKSLEAALASARTMVSRQENLRSQARDVTSELKGLLRNGDNLRARLISNLKGKLGFSTQKLSQYGVKPRSEVVRRRKKDKPQEPPVPVPVKTAPASPAKP